MPDEFQKTFTELISIIEHREYNKLSGSSIEVEMIQHYMKQKSKF